MGSSAASVLTTVINVVSAIEEGLSETWIYAWYVDGPYETCDESGSFYGRSHGVNAKENLEYQVLA